MISEACLFEIETGQRDITPDEDALLYRLLRAKERPVAECSAASVVEFSAASVSGQRQCSFLRIPGTRVSDNDSSAKTRYNRAAMYDWFGKQIGAGVKTLSAVVKKSPTQYTKAINMSGIRKIVLSVKDSLHLQSTLGLTHTGLRIFRRECSILELPMRLAPETSMRAEVSAMQLLSEYYEGASLHGGKDGPVSCLIYVAHTYDVIIRDLDRLFLNGEYYEWPFRCNSALTQPVISAEVSQDWGGGSEKFAIHILNRKNPCSAKAQTPFCTAQAERICDASRKITGNYSNFEIELSKVHGIHDLHLCSIVRLDNSHAILPTRIIPDVWLVVVISAADMPGFIANAYGGVCSPVQQTDRRAALLEKSAHLVVIGNECIGIRSGDVSFPFRIPVVVNLDTVADALIICLLHIYLCSDLLALATLIGHPGQAGCSCMWCRVCAANTKRTAADVTIQFPYRTPASEAIDLAAFRSKTGAKPTPVNGVLMPPLLPITDFMKVMMPVLHCFLGLVNFVVQRINKVGTCVHLIVMLDHRSQLFAPGATGPRRY